MQNSHSSCCCGGGEPPVRGDNRRGFFGQAAAIVCGGLALLVPAAAGIAAFLNPLRQKGQSGQFLRLASLDVLPEDGTPQKFPVIADRTDAWNRFPAGPIGAVYLLRNGGQVTALQVALSPRGLLDRLRLAAARFSLARATSSRSSTSQGSEPTARTRIAPATWTLWKSKSATPTTRKKCGSSSRPSCRAWPRRLPKDRS